MPNKKVLVGEKANRAIHLYTDKIQSGSDVARTLGVGIQTVYRFLRREGIRRRDRTEAAHARFEQAPPSFSLKTRLSISEENLKFGSCMLYWAEGAKRGRVVDFANSDPDMCAIFIRFL